MPTMLEIALAYAHAGLSVIPARGKQPYWDVLPRGENGKATWKPFENTIADDATLTRWFSKGNPNIALIGGAVSGGLVVLDFDLPELFFKWKLKTWNISKSLPQEKTARGYHAFFAATLPAVMKNLG